MIKLNLSKMTKAEIEQLRATLSAFILDVSKRQEMTIAKPIVEPVKLNS